ncbi:MAG: hypothetical protein ACT4QD_21550 [Acidobacteriota bacterium]
MLKQLQAQGLDLFAFWTPEELAALFTRSRSFTRLRTRRPLVPNDLPDY